MDIEDISNPTIVILSDLVSAQHSMIDPCSESVQIVGRFRRPENGTIKKEVFHITNIDPTLKSQTEQEVIQYIKECKVVHKIMSRFYRAATTVGAKTTLKEILTRIEFARYMNLDDTYNYFMIDNTIHEEKVKGYYQSIENLLIAYENSKHFHVQHTHEVYEFSDLDRARITVTAPMKTAFEVIMPKLKELYDETKHSDFSRELQLFELKNNFPKVMEAFHKIGLEKARELDFKPKKIREAIDQKEKSSQVSDFGMIQFIEQNFKVGETYTSAYITRKLKEGIALHKLTRLTAGVPLLKTYCALSARVYMFTNPNGRDVMGYTVYKIYDGVKN